MSEEFRPAIISNVDSTFGRSNSPDEDDDSTFLAKGIPINSQRLQDKGK